MAMWFGSKSDPIGVDLGRSSLKLAQVSCAGGQPRLSAAATVEVPESLRASSNGPHQLLRDAVEPALAKNGFRGRRVVLGMPASCMHIDRLRLPASLSEEQMRQTVAWEAVDRLPFHPSRAMLRHLIAGEVHEANELRSEVILLAARNDLTESLLDAARRAKLDVIGFVPEPLALMGGFARTGAAAQAQTTRAVVDIGHGATRLYIARGKLIEFARSIGIGWNHLDANATRPAGEAQSTAGGDSSGGATTAVLQAQKAATAIAPEPLRRLVSELSMSCHYHAETFPNSPVAEAVVVGGVATDRRLVAHLSAMLGVPVRGGDPLSPFGPQSARSAGGGIPSRPEWAVAIGLSLSHAA